MVTVPRPNPSLSVRAQAPARVPELPRDRGLTWRPLGPGDLPELTRLTSTIEQLDRTPFRTSPEEVVEWLTGSWKDLSADTVGGFEASGALRAYALAELPPGDVSLLRSWVHGGVHPAYRGRGIGRDLVRWMDARGRQQLAAAGADAPARLVTFLEDDALDQRRLFEAAGFTPRRQYTAMRRDLRAPSPRVELPNGLRLLPWSPGIDEQIRLAHNEAFADHWGSQPQTVEQWSSGHAQAATSWSFAVLDQSATGPEPAVVGYLMSARIEQDWPVLGYTYGYVHQLGVRRAWRGRGLSVALLGAAMDAYRADGMEYAVLDVDTENPTGAYGLYARVGFEPTHGAAMYTIEL